jgi:hypothetical protein
VPLPLLLLLLLLVLMALLVSLLPPQPDPTAANRATIAEKTCLLLQNAPGAESVMLFTI